MANYTAGSVSAEIILDTSQFTEAIGKLKKEIEGLQTTFNSVKGKDNLTETVQALKEEIKSLQTENDKLKKGIKQGAESIKKDFQEATGAIEKVDKSTQLFREHFEAITNGTYLGKKISADFEKIPSAVDKATSSVKRYATETGKAVEQNIKLARETNKTVLGNTYYKGGMPSGIKADMMLNGDWEEAGRLLSGMLSSSDRLKLSILALGQAIKQTNINTNRFAEQAKQNIKIMENWALANEKFKAGSSYTGLNYLNDNFKVDTTALRNASKLLNQTKLDWMELYRNTNQYSTRFYNEQNLGMSTYKQRIEEVSAALQKLYVKQERYYASVGAMSWKYWRQIRNSTVDNNTVWNSDKTWNTAQFKAQTVGLQEYYSNINKVTSAVEKLKKAQQALASDKKAYNTANIKQAGEALQVMNRQLERNILLEKRRRDAVFQKDSIAYSTQNLQAASAGMALLNEQSTKYNNNISKTTENVRKAGKGITTFNNGIVQTAHSGRILSNTLYQIRGALLSLKMIATAMGGMMLWGFAMEIAEGVKSTFTAKNELEAQLKQNAKVGQNGLRDFNNELDNTIKKFQKVNKYQLGETVSSLGVEFELSMKQMKKAMPIVAMIQSEYIRAGRTSEEAALAVKDILQGEFQRLSRETGVGKDELTKYGWSGDKTDLDSLLDAVKKAGEDRNWDIFAAKATSLNDVMEITKNRFEEFGADLLQSISPAIVSGFNTIIDTISGLQNAFNSLGTFSQNAILGGTFIGGITAVATLLPMITKGMGLSEIATLGWGKALGTAVFNLNKAEVGALGFRKALAAVISGTSAAELSEVRWSKAIAGRILGVNQGVLAQQGYLGALVHSRMVLKGHNELEEAGQVILGNTRQKLIYLAKGTIVADKSAATYTKTLKSLITSTRLWGVAIKGVIGIGLVAWFATLATWADTVKGRIENYNDFIDNGKEKIKSAQTTLDNYNKKLNEMKDTDPNYALIKSNRDTAQHNLASITAANELAQSIKKNAKEVEESNNLMIKGGINSIYSQNGLKNVEKYGEEYQQMKYTAYDIAKSEEESYKFRYASLQHITEHTNEMKKAGIEEKARIKYITEYSAKASEVAENLKKFNQGDLTAGVYYAFGRLQLLWIDLWNDKDFIVFWDTVKRTFNDIKPTLIWVKDTLMGLGRDAMKFFSTEQGRWVGAFLAIAGGVALVGYKFRGVLGTLKDLGKSIWNRIKDFKKLNDVASETTTSTDTTSTGGIKGKGELDGKGWWDKGQLQQDTRKYARAAVAIAAGMVLISEAILFMMLPMGSLAVTGEAFEHLEPSIKKGVKGLQMIAPVMAVLMPPIVALMYIVQQYSGVFKDGAIGNTLRVSAKVIATGMLLVSEAIVMMVAPMIAISAVGAVKGLLGDSVEKGKAAIEATTDALGALVPVIPLFVIAIGAGIIALSGVGALASAGVIASGMLLVSWAILTLGAPMLAIAALGGTFSNLNGIRKGAEAIKVCAEALGYVELATRNLALVKWELLGQNIATILASWTGMDLNNLSELTEEGGMFDELKKFFVQFNKIEFESPKTDKVEAVKGIAEGMKSISEAMQYVKQAMDNLPPEFKGETSADQYGRQGNGGGAFTATSVEDYFATFEEPLKQLKLFIDKFNTDDSFKFEKVAPERLEAINSAADTLQQINSVVENVKSVMGNVAWANVSSNAASVTGSDGGGIGAFFGGIGAMFNIGTGVGANGASSGDYQSSIGSSLNEMEKVIKDLVTFDTNISSILGGGNGGGAFKEGSDTSKLTQMVTDVSNAIKQINDVLTTAVPTAKTNGTNIGTAISSGIKSGMGNLTNIIVPPFIVALNSAKANAGTYGKGIGWSLTNGFKTELKIKSETETEISGTLTYLEGKKQEFYDKGYALGDSLSSGYKDGQDMHSPGIIARSTKEELDRVMGYFGDAQINLPQMAFNLANALSSNFSFDLGLSNLQLPDLDTFQQGLQTILPTVDSVKTQVSSSFETMKTNVGMALSNTAMNATQKYQQIVANTRTSMSNMYSSTTKHISGIKTSWRGMQDALIASAENIRSQTSQKISTLQSNMGSFWNKVRNPSLLLGGTANVARHSIPQRSSRGIASNSNTRRMLMAGSSKLGSRVTGISDRFQPRKNSSKKDIIEDLREYLACLQSDGFCVAGGWNFDWSPSIKSSFTRWNTHFGQLYDDVLNVGKFENDNFPVRGNKTIALRYIQDAIGRTSYEHYYNYKYGSPLAAWLAGHFNCVEGAEIAIALASAFGFGGGHIGYGTWDGEGHGFAVIPGLGVIDATAIQQGYGLKSPKVRGYSAGSPKGSPRANNYNGDVIINIHTDGNDVEIDEQKIDNETGRRIIDLLGINPATGR